MRDSSSLFLFSTVIYTSGRLAVLADGNIFAPLDDTTQPPSTTTASIGATQPPPITIAHSDLSNKCGDFGYVDCEDGHVRGDAGTTCTTACDGQCCVGIVACNGFTGIVCKDGSCSSGFACNNAVIPLVVNSCKDGSSVCERSPGQQGNIGSIVNSCTGDSACLNLGVRGEVGDVQDGIYACLST